MVVAMAKIEVAKGRHQAMDAPWTKMRCYRGSCSANAGQKRGTRGGGFHCLHLVDGGANAAFL